MKKIIILSIVIIFPLTLFADKYTISKKDLNYEKKGIDYYRRGDINDYFNTILDLIKENPSSPLSQYYILTLRMEKNSIKDYDKIYPVLEKIISKEKGIDFLTYNFVLEELIQYYLNKGRYRQAARLLKKSGAIDKWKYAGPFIKTYYEDINENFLGLDGSLTFSKKVWKKLPFNTDWGWVPLDVIIYPSYKSTSYCGCNINIPYTGDFIVWLTSEASVKLFIDGTVIFTNDSKKSDFEINTLYRINLKKGWHYFVVKTSPIYINPNFKLRVLNEQGYSLKKLEISLDDKNIEKNKITYKKIYPKLYNFFRNKIKSEPFESKNYIYTGLLEFSLFSTDRSIRTFVKGTTVNKKDYLLKYYLGKIYYYRYVTEYKSIYLHKAKELFEDIVENDKNFIRAREYLAKCKLNLDKIDESYKILKSISYVYPNLFLVYSRYFKKIGWNYLSLKSIWSAYFLNKNYTFVSQKLADIIENYNFDIAGGIYKNNFERDYTLSANFFEYCLKSNNFKDLLKGLDRLNRISKYSKDYYNYLAKYYEAEGKIDKAIKVLKNLFAINPSDKVLEKIGDLYYDLKDYKNAKKYWLKSFVLKPQNLKVEKKLDYLQDKTPDGATLEEKFYKVNVEDIISKAFEDENPVENSLKYYLDLMIISVNNNGTYKYLVHQIVKILNEQGKERFGEISVPSGNNVKIIRIGTYTKKGSFLDATDYKEHNNKNYISLPSLEIGTIAEICYEVNVDTSWFDNTYYFYYNPFMFQDKDYDVENSVFVLVQPKDGNKIRFSLRNGDDIIYAEKTTDNKLIQIWRKDYSKAVDMEFNSPPLLDMVPNIIVSSIPDWKTFSKWYWGKIKGKFVYDFELEQKILDLYEKSKIDGEVSKFNLIKNIYYWIQRNIVSQQDYLYYPKSTDEIFFRREGNTEEKVLLMRYMLKKLNIDSDIVLVRNNNFSKIDFSLPIPYAFNSVLLMIKLKDKNLFVDFSNKYLPFGYVDFMHINDKGFLIKNGGGYKFINIKPYYNNSIIEEDFFINLEKKRMDVEGRILHKGDFNTWKANYDNSTTRETLILERINNCYDGIDITSYSISNIEQLNKDLLIHFKGEIDLSESEKNVDLILDKLKMSEKYISSQKRKYPLQIYRPVIKKIVIVIKMPEKIKLKRMDNLSLKLQKSFGSYYFNVSRRKNQVIIERYINLLPVTISLKQYNGFLDFCKKIDRIEKEKFTIFYRDRD